MSPTTASPPLPRHPGGRFQRRGEGAEQPGRVKARGRTPAGGGDVIARHLDGEGRRREIVLLAGAAGSRLVVDRDQSTLADRRLVAHLAADEPPASAEAACSAYMSDPEAHRPRRVRGGDLRLAPPGDLEAMAAQAPSDRCAALAASALTAGAASIAAEAGVAGAETGELGSGALPGAVAQGAAVCRPLIGPGGEQIALRLIDDRASISQLRWCELPAGRSEGELRQCSVREVVGRLQSYEPVRAITAKAILTWRDDRDISVAGIAVELQRLSCSRTVLNRGLRERALALVGSGEVSMSEIALRCGRVKRSGPGIVSGETTWLARRLGLAADAAGKPPTPWVRSDVLAMIAREGLGVSPREVELG